MTLELVVGVGIVIFSFIIVGLNMKEKKPGEDNFLTAFFFRNFFILSAIALLFIVPNALLFSEKTCVPVVSQTAVNGTTTTYTYVDHCTVEKSGATAFHKAFKIITYVLLVFLGVLLVVNIVNYLRKAVKKI